MPIDVDAIPDPVVGYDEVHNTIVVAQPVQANAGIELELYADG